MVPSPDPDQVRTAEVAAALCLATDLGMGLPFEQGLQAAVVAMRVAERLGVDEATARQTYLRVPAVLRRVHGGRGGPGESCSPRARCSSAGRRSCSGVPGRRRSAS